MAYFYTEDNDTGVTGQRVTGRGEVPGQVSAVNPTGQGLTGSCGTEAVLGQGDARWS